MTHRALLLFACVVLLAGASSSSALSPSPVAALDGLEGANTPVRLHFSGVELSKVFEAIGAASGFSVTCDGPGFETKVDLDRKDVAIAKEILLELAKTHGLSYELKKTDHLVVRSVAKGKQAS